MLIFWKQYMYTYYGWSDETMGKARQCVLCGRYGGCGLMIMGQYVCLDCQTLLDDPKRRVFGCRLNRRFSKAKPAEDLELAKAGD